MQARKMALANILVYLVTDEAEAARSILQKKSGRLQGQEMMEAGLAFFGYQGPWYTVGWKIAVTIETMLGRQRLINRLRDPCRLFYTYNQAVAQMGETPLPAWSTALTDLYGEWRL